MKKEPKITKHAETHDEWVDRTCNEAEAEANAKGWLTTEQVEESMAKLKHEYYKKHAQAA